MSSISGIVQFAGGPVDRRRADALLRPSPGNRVDALHEWIADGVFFGHVLASIVPESQAETQPLVDPASGCVIAFDGRLDNREELQPVLSEFQALLDLKTDSAYALAAYRRWREDAPRHLLGDFGFAIWDPRDKRLLLARDPMGQRALYYSQDGRSFAFASTLEQLLQDLSISHDLDDDTLVRYVYRYGAIPESTPYRAIKSLAGGTRLLLQNGQSQIQRYFDWPAEPPPARPLTPDDLEQFRELFTRSVVARLRSHAPVGLLLSGGLDSNSIAAVAGQLHERQGMRLPRTYTFAFEQFPECDERRYVEASIARYGFPSTYIPADQAWSLSNLEEWLPVFSEPYFAPFDGMTYRALEQARRDGVRTVLMGHGGDALLDGSPRYFADLLLAGRWRELHGQVRAHSTATHRPYLVSLIGNGVTPLLPIWARRWVEFRHLPSLAPLIPDRLRGLHLDDPPLLYRGRGAWWYILHHIVRAVGNTPHEAHLDRMMRLFGMEIRQPFMDVRLVEFILKLPPEATFSEGTRRFIVRQSLHDLLPPSIRERRDKTTLLPLMNWGLVRQRRTFVEALLADPELARRGVVNERGWREAIQNYLDGRGPLLWVFWYGLTLEIWLRLRTGRLPPVASAGDGIPGGT